MKIKVAQLVWRKQTKNKGKKKSQVYKTNSVQS